MDAAVLPEPLVSLFEAIVSRRSIRAFTDRPVPRETLEAILRLGGRAPSGSNIQPWKVHVLQGAVKQALSEDLLAAALAAAPSEAEYTYYPRTWREPYLARRRATGFGLYALLGIGRGDREAMRRQHARNFLFFDAPVGLIFTIDRELELGSWLDYGMFLQTIMLAARGFGLHTCPQAAFIEHAGIVRRRLNLPEGEKLVCGMALGHAADAVENRLATAREPLSSFVTFHDERP